MTYSSVVEMAQSDSLLNRVAAAAASEGFEDDPVSFARNMIWQIVASPGWSEAWDSAQAAASVNDNPDTGARDDVITDGMILSAVQPLLNPPDPEPIP